MESFDEKTRSRKSNASVALRGSYIVASWLNSLDEWREWATWFDQRDRKLEVGSMVWSNKST